MIFVQGHVERGNIVRGSKFQLNLVRACEVLLGTMPGWEPPTACTEPQEVLSRPQLC